MLRFSHYCPSTRRAFEVETCETCGGVVQAPNGASISAPDARRIGLTFVDREPPEQFYCEDVDRCGCEECNGQEPQAAPEPEVLRTSKGHTVHVVLTDAQAAEILAQGRTNFARSLAHAWKRYGSWTPGQRPWAHLIANEVANPPAPQPAAPATPAEDLGSIVRMLHGAQAHLKYPKVRLEVDGRPLVLSVAGERARQPRTINVTDGGPYGASTFYGRISLEGAFQASPRVEQDWVLQALQEFATDPAGNAAAYGQRTGSCCFCGRELTADDSLAVGYGPVCADRYGLPHGG